MLRVLFFDFVDEYGGMPRATIDLAELVRDEVEVFFIDPVGCCEEYRQRVLAGGFHYEVLDPGRGMLNLNRTRSVERALSLLRQSRRFWNVTRLLADAVRRLQPDLIWTSSTKGLALCHQARAGGQPVMLHFRRTWTPDYARGWVGYLMTRPTTTVLSLAPALSRDLIAGGVPASRVLLVPDAVDEADLRRRIADPLNAPLPEPRRPVRILLPGTMQQRKGHCCAVRALARLVKAGRDAELIFPGAPISQGSQVWKHRIEETARELRVTDRVHFIGWRTDMPRLIHEADVIVLPSTDEGTPLVLLEAMSLERPVISTPVGGIPDIIHHGDTGWLHPVDDDAALARCVEQALDPAVRDPMLARALRHVRDEFSPARQRELAVEAFHKTLAVVKKKPR